MLDLSLPLFLSLSLYLSPQSVLPHPHISEMVKTFLRLSCLVTTLLKKVSLFDMDN